VLIIPLLQLFEILTSDDDVVTLVLRGHLVIEELLYTAIAAHCQEPDLLKDANLKYSQLIPLFRSLAKIHLMKEKDWAILTELNSLRNALAHRTGGHLGSNRTPGKDDPRARRDEIFPASITQ
jgi:hypothetical protein